MKSISTLLCGVVFSFGGFAQELVKETTIPIDRKSAKGLLSVVRVDDDRKEISLVYNTKEKAKKTKFTNYVFNYNLEQLSKEDGEEPKFKNKGAKSAYRGEELHYMEVGLVANNFGTLTAKVTQVDAKWSRFWGDYMYKRKSLKDEKLRSSDDRKLFLKWQVTLETGEAIAFTAPKLKPKEIKTKSGEQLIIKVNDKLEIVKETKLDLSTEHTVKWAQEYDGKIYAIYGPMKLMGGPKCTDPTKRTVVVIDSKTLEVIEKHTFNTKVGQWGILNAQFSERGLTLVGPGNIKKPGLVDHNDVLANDVKKFDAFQVVHLNKKGEIKVVVTTNDDINSKAVKFPTEKKPISYNGKKYAFVGAKVIDDKHGFLIAMQDFKTGQNGVKIYKEMIFLHFSLNGELMGYYAIPSTAKKEATSILNDFEVYPSADDPSKINILVIQPHHLYTWTESSWGSGWTYVKAVCYPRFVQFDLNKKEFTKNLDLGNQEYFLYGLSTGIQSINNGKELLFIGESENQKTLYLARFKL